MKFNLFKFEHHWGGEDNWYTKSKRWAKKQPVPFNHLITGFIEWLRIQWNDGKIIMAMDDVDRQTSNLIEEWEDEERKQFAPEIVERGVFGDEGWSISITNPVIERRSSPTSTGMVAPSDAQRLQKDEGDQGRSS
tara:strand:+ start:689 stop:1093 length:405 start_codon:yes stop_codon:yes gene_type:complete